MAAFLYMGESGLAYLISPNRIILILRKRIQNALSEPLKPGYDRFDFVGKVVQAMDNRNQFLGLGLGLGLVIGLFIGLALDQIALGIPIGVALGAGLGIVLAQTMDRFG